MPPDLALSSTLIGSNYPCLELIFMVPKVFEPLKFDCSIGLDDSWSDAACCGVLYGFALLAYVPFTNGLLFVM